MGLGDVRWLLVTGSQGKGGQRVVHKWMIPTKNVRSQELGV